MAFVFALIGASIVLVLDRNFIYLADTRYETDKKLTYIYLGIRIFLITVIGSLSSQFTMPLFLKSELAIHAQDMKDGRFSEAKERYQAKYELSDKTENLNNLEGRAVKLKKEIASLTPELVLHRSEVNHCFSEYTKKTKMTFAPDLDEHEIINLYAKDKRECERIEGLYREAHRAYVAPKEAELAQMGEAITQAQSNIDSAKKDIAQDLEKATVINEAYINVASADVLSSLVRHNPGAFMKYALLTLLQLCLELMPILLKLQAGQSPLGHEMAIYAQITLARHEHALVEKEQFANRQEFDSQVVKQKIMQDLENEQLRQELNELKRQTSAYARAQHQFTQSFAHATDQFVNRVVVPTVNMAVKPFATSTIQTTSTSVPEDQSAGAKVFKFGDPIDQGVKAAS